MIDNSLYKLPPQNIEAEQSILASCLITSDALEFTENLLPSDFYRTAHQKIFQVIISLLDKKQPIDLITVMTKLKESKQLDEIGGAIYLSELTDIPIATGIKHYISMVKSTSIARQLIEASNEIANLAYQSNGNIIEVLEEAQTKIININFDLDNDNFVSVSDLTMQRVEQYEKMASSKKVLGITTGFSGLDRLTGGLKGSKFIIIAARPRIGKTALMMNLASNMAKAGHKVGIFSIEMDKEELIDRMISSKSEVNTIKLASGQWISSEEWVKIHDAAAKIYEYPIIIDDTGGLKIYELKRRAKKMVKEGVEIIFIDQLSKIRGGKGKTEYEQKTYIVNEIAILKKELRIPICLLAQINRKLEDRQNKKPTLGDLKSTGSLEEDADIILLGHREYEYTKAEEDINKAEWEIAKQKQGATCNLHMHWNGKTVTFSSIQEGDYHE